MAQIQGHYGGYVGGSDPPLRAAAEPRSSLPPTYYQRPEIRTDVGPARVPDSAQSNVPENGLKLVLSLAHIKCQRSEDRKQAAIAARKETTDEQTED